MDGKVDDASEGVNAWLAEVEGREEQAITKAGDKVDAVAAEAVNVLGLACASPSTLSPSTTPLTVHLPSTDAWLDDVTRHDWARYHGITKGPSSYRGTESFFVTKSSL